MISVGLDITRLGTMIVLGQPKGTAEYIQATSRVGRDQNRPGLVVSLFNVHKPRDRSHYEHFALYHKCFYRGVEASSVTPYAPRALDRALAASLIAVCRHSYPDLTPSSGADHIGQFRTQLGKVAIHFSERAERLTQGDGARLLNLCCNLLDTWSDLQQERQKNGIKLHYQNEDRTAGATARLLHDFLEQNLPAPAIETAKFRANRSMRDVEPNVKLTVRTLDEPLSIT
jgi:ATP-dependent helicase YprA (DUF1998 family)